MNSKLFTPFTIKDITLNNRIVMSPMCMYSALNKNGMITDWHTTHYVSRAVGGVGLIIIEATAVAPEGRISYNDLGIWSDEHIDGLKQVVDQIHANGSKAGIQIGHAGRKAELQERIIAPSPIPFPDMKIPDEASKDDIQQVIYQFQEGARRAKEAGFDVIEIHAAHGYLVSEFLSPLTNHRNDEYGGDAQRRYRLLSEIIEAVTTVWDGPLFVRVSAEEYAPNGNTVEQFIAYSRLMKEQGVDLIDCSSGGIVPAPIQVYPGYQVNLADRIRREASIATGAVGLITSAIQAEEILGNERADLILLGRELLRNPYWAFQAARELRIEVERPRQYLRS